MGRNICYIRIARTLLVFHTVLSATFISSGAFHSFPRIAPGSSTLNSLNLQPSPGTTLGLMRQLDLDTSQG